MRRKRAKFRRNFILLLWIGEGEDASLHTPDEDRAFFRDHVFKNCEIWGACDASVIGFVAFRPGWIEHLYVLPRWQGGGAGGVLLEVAKNRSSSLQLWTFQKNASARGFYEKRGFAAIEETDGGRNEEREPDVLYRWVR